MDISSCLSFKMSLQYTSRRLQVICWCHGISAECDLSAWAISKQHAVARPLSSFLSFRQDFFAPGPAHSSLNTNQILLLFHMQFTGSGLTELRKTAVIFSQLIFLQSAHFLFLCLSLSLSLVLKAKVAGRQEIVTGNDVYGNPIKRIQYDIKQMKVFLSLLSLLCQLPKEMCVHRTQIQKAETTPNMTWYELIHPWVELASHWNLFPPDWKWKAKNRD